MCIMLKTDYFKRDFRFSTAGKFYELSELSIFKPRKATIFSTKSIRKIVKGAIVHRALP